MFFLCFVAAVDEGINQIKDVLQIEKDCLKQRVASAINNIPTKYNLTQDEQQTLKQLKNDRSITIVPADKGRVTVVIDTTDY